MTELQNEYTEAELYVLDNVSPKEILRLCFNVLGCDGRNLVVTRTVNNRQARLTVGELITAALVSMEEMTK